jgi:DNA-binding response OmpR family regulator
VQQCPYTIGEPSDPLMPHGAPGHLRRRPGTPDTEDLDQFMNSPSETTTVLVFSHRPEVREAIINAVGRRPAADVGRVSYIEAATIAEVLTEVDAGRVDLAIFDGEAQPTGGMGLSRQLKNEIRHCPPVIIAVRRRDDRWLAVWSQADAVIVHPLDPLTAAETVAEVLRNRLPQAANG